MAFDIAPHSFFVSTFLDCTEDSQHHTLHFCAKIKGKGHILIELWPGPAKLDATMARFHTKTCQALALNAKVLAQWHMSWFEEVEVVCCVY
jgi:hypothetical protein